MKCKKRNIFDKTCFEKFHEEEKIDDEEKQKKTWKKFFKFFESFHFTFRVFWFFIFPKLKFAISGNFFGELQLFWRLMKATFWETKLKVGKSSKGDETRIWTFLIFFQISKESFTWKIFWCEYTENIGKNRRINHWKFFRKFSWMFFFKSFLSKIDRSNYIF